jgi:hypothetical protein
MDRMPAMSPQAAVAPPRTHRVLAHLALNLLALLAAAGAFVAHQHFKLQGQSSASLVSLVLAAVLVLIPVRAVLGIFLGVERRLLHGFHGVGALALTGLAASGYVSGGTLLNHSAMAPFALMGAAQAIMHQNHPRNAQQAAALQRFATSLPEVAEFTRGDLSSPANAARAVKVLQDLIGKAEALGETELQADPNFQSALARATTRTGLTLGLDSIDQGIDRLGANPATASAVPDLKRRLARARSIAQASAR